MEFNFEIVKHIGVIKQYEDSWAKELNIVSWIGNEPKIDIREWSSDHKKMSRGITMTEDEAEKVCMMLHNYLAERSAK